MATPRAAKGVEMLPLQECQGPVWDELKEISQEFRAEMSKKAATYAETVQKDDALVLRVLRDVTNTENAPAEPGKTPRKAHPLQPPKLAAPAKAKDVRVQSQSARSAKSACSKATAKTPAKTPRAPRAKPEDAKHEIKRPKEAPPKNVSTPLPKKDAEAPQGPTSPVPPPPVGILNTQPEEGREEAVEAPEQAPTEKKGKRSSKKSEKKAAGSPAQPVAAPEPAVVEEKPEEDAPPPAISPKAAARKSGSPSSKDRKRKRTLSNKAKAKKEMAAEDADTAMAGTEEVKVEAAPLPETTKDDAATWLLNPEATQAAAPTTEPTPVPEAAPPVKADKKSKGTQGKKSEAASQAASPERKKKRTQSKKGGAERASKKGAKKADQAAESKAEEPKQSQGEAEKQVGAGDAPSTPQAPADAGPSQHKEAKEKKLSTKKAAADDAETWLLKPDATPMATATPQPLEGFPGLPSVTPIENPRQFLQIIQPADATAAQEPAAVPKAASEENVKADEPTAAAEEKTGEKVEEKEAGKAEEKCTEKVQEEAAEKAKKVEEEVPKKAAPEAEDKVPPKVKTPEHKEAEARRLDFDSAKSEAKDAEAPEPKEPPKLPLKTPKKKEIDALPKLKTPGAATKTPKAAAAVKRAAASESDSAKRARHLALFAPGTRARTAMVKEWVGKLSAAQPAPLVVRGDYAVPQGNDLMRDLEQRRLAADLMRAQAKLKRQKKQLVKMAK